MNDLISRQVAIDRIESIRPENPKKSDYTHGINVGMAMALVAIKEQPSAQPMRPKGEWIADNYGNTICSECRWYAPKIMQGSLTTRKLEYYKSDFCWNCGADMRGETG